MQILILTLYLQKSGHRYRHNRSEQNIVLLIIMVCTILRKKRIDERKKEKNRCHECDWTSILVKCKTMAVSHQQKDEEWQSKNWRINYKVWDSKCDPLVICWDFLSFYDQQVHIKPEFLGQTDLLQILFIMLELFFCFLKRCNLRIKVGKWKAGCLMCA